MTVLKAVNGSIINDYEFIKEIGSGAYGIVYSAKHIVTGQKVAIKCLSKIITKPLKHGEKQSDLLSKQLSNYFVDNDYNVQGLNSLNLKLLSEFSATNSGVKCCSFIKEISIHLKVHDHPNVITIHKIIDSPVALFIVMDYFPEGDLFINIVDRSKYSSDPMLIKKVFIQLIDVISYCHSKNIYHCDIKPENIMCAQNGTNLCIGDFGLAVESSLINAKTCIGSSYYMPPERLISMQNDKQVTRMKTTTTGGGCPFNHGNATRGTAVDKLPSDLSAQSFPAEAGDLWSLAIILINLTCTRNPWMKACSMDNTYSAFLKNKHVLKEILPISDELYEILCLCLERDPFKRITLFQLRELVIQCQSFTTTGPLSLCSTNMSDFIKDTCDVPDLNKSEEIKAEDIVTLQDILPVNHIPIDFGKFQQDLTTTSGDVVSPLGGDDTSPLTAGVDAVDGTDNIEGGYHVDFINNSNWVQHLELFDNCSVMTNVSFNMNCDMIDTGLY